MEQKLFYKKKVGNQIILTDEERGEIAKKIVEFMRQCLVIEDYIHNDEHWGNYKHYYYFFNNWKFGESYYRRVQEKEGYKIKDTQLLNDFVEVGGMFDRFTYHIRMNASMPHIKKMIEILGEKVSVAYLEYWAKKNLAVSLILKEFIEKLKGADLKDKPNQVTK